MCQASNSGVLHFSQSSALLNLWCTQAWHDSQTLTVTARAEGRKMLAQDFGIRW
jgi:hypothetical protein